MIFISMKKMLVVISEEAYGILRRYKEEQKVSNLDTALDTFLKEKSQGEIESREVNQNE